MHDTSPLCRFCPAALNDRSTGLLIAPTNCSIRWRTPKSITRESVSAVGAHPGLTREFVERPLSPCWRHWLVWHESGRFGPTGDLDHVRNAPPLRPERPVESLPKSRRSPEASFPIRATRLCWKAIRRAVPTAPAMRPPRPVVLPQAPPWTDRLRGDSAAFSRPGPRRSRS
ncbi:hypothetical protein SAMN02927900_03047 [Rhizobium mongolense subsp. loessense]|uniref:Uncharacterized protein n=1 Tax=Rhizobium mongolense subsp. loessense TaxID=158890 RepID=A0A1G4RUV4_9HYPH|nr:hypothetical protein SAMN02927900_03047 [Rhizobium mongolense subsp. loessense]